MPKILKTVHRIVGLPYVRRFFVAVATITLIFLSASGTVVALSVKSSVRAELTQANQPVDMPIVMQFSSTVASVGRLTISPDVEGEWRYQAGILGIKGVEFHPKKDLQPYQQYKVSIGGAKKLVTGEVSKIELTVKTEEAPGVVSFSPNINYKGAIAADYRFEARLIPDLIDGTDIDLVINPKVDLKFSKKADKYTWVAEGLLPQGQDITVSLVDRTNNRTLLKRQLAVVKQPQIKEYFKEQGVLPGEDLRLEFAEPMNKKKVPVKSRFFDDGKWVNDTIYAVKLGKVSPGQVVEYEISEGVRTKRGGVLTETVKKSITARGEVAVMLSSPSGEGLSQSAQMIQVAFNQPVDKRSAEERFRISSGEVKSFSWQGDTLSARVVNLGYQNRVTVSVLSGVMPAGFGLASIDDFNFSFTTEAQSMILNVPLYKQVFNQSCEASSLRMALAYRGVHSSDWDILQRFGYNPTHKDFDNNIWDDPQKQFVGDVNGSQGGGTGWGVYAEPVAAAARSFGREATVQYSVPASFIANQIYQNRPVIFWGIWGGSAGIQTWTTPSGGTASGPFPMHVRLVVGVYGPPENPIGFRVHDPITGAAYWSTAQLMDNMRRAGPANQAVAIH